MLLSRLSGRVRTQLYLCLWVLVLVVWAWSTGWRTYFIRGDIPVLLLLILALLFIGWLDSRHRRLYVSDLGGQQIL